MYVHCIIYSFLGKVRLTLFSVKVVVYLEYTSVKVNVYFSKKESLSPEKFLLPMSKGAALQGKNLLPAGSKFFPLREVLFEEGFKHQGNQSFFV